MYTLEHGLKTRTSLNYFLSNFFVNTLPYFKKLITKPFFEDSKTNMICVQSAVDTDSEYVYIVCGVCHAIFGLLHKF